MSSMSFQTATRFRWVSYTKTWLVRAFGASIVCSLLLAALASLGWIGFLIGGLVSSILVGAVLLWTVAEMIEDGLSNETSTVE